MAVNFSEIAGILNAARDAHTSSREGFLLHILVAEDAPREAVCTVRDVLIPDNVLADIEIQRLDAFLNLRPQYADAALIFSGSNQDLVAQASRYYASAGTPCALLADSSLEVPDAEKCSVADGAPVSLIAAAEPETLVKALARWLVDATPKGIAVAAAFPFTRHAEARALVNNCASSNAGVVFLGVTPGAEMSVLTAKQVMLSLDLAAAFGCTSLPIRSAVSVFVIAAGFVWRGVARFISRDQMQMFARFVRAGIATGGTMISGWGVVVILESALNEADSGVQHVFAQRGEV